MEFLRGELALTGATVTTEEINTPVSKTQELAMLIHEINKICESVELIALNTAINEFTLNSEAHTGEATSPDFNDPDTIYRVDHTAEEGILTSAKHYSGPTSKKGDPPLLYTKGKMYFEGRQRLAGQATQYASIQIGYTLEKVSKEAYIDALVG